jgi:hypothetical protein
MLRLLACAFSNKNVTVTVDRRLIPSIARNNSHITQQTFNPNNVHTIRINLLKLITATATIQTRRTNPTKFNKLLDFSYLLDYIKLGNDFCVTKHADSDKQIAISEDLGVGLSIVVTDHFYKIDWRTLGKIQRRQGSLPDISCESISRRESITIEAKGSTSTSWRNCQKAYAVNQKNGPTPAMVYVASCALLNENSISDIDYLDPPIIPPKDPMFESALLKCDHYSRTFNLIGQKELSKYYDLMRLRLLYDRDFKQFEEKQDLYQKIKTNYVHMQFGQNVFYGNIEKIDEEAYAFVGIDSRLLNVYTFLQFEGQEERSIKEYGNEFYLTPDGLCIGRLSNLRLVDDQISAGQVPHHYDSFSIVDFDYGRESTLTGFLSHVILNAGGKIRGAQGFDRRYDLIASLNNRMFALEIKRYIGKDYEKILSLIAQLKLEMDLELVLITNAQVSEDVRAIIEKRNVILIDRKALLKIIENKKAILDYLG